MQHRQQGFTLIEIAIVLIIVGLLLGGVMKGQSLITQGKIRSVARELDSVAVAVNSYRDRYKALPGDDKGGAGRWSGSPASSATAGDSKIDGDFNSTTDGNESRLAWVHLRLAGFIAGDSQSQQQPSNPVGGITGIQNSLATSSDTPIFSGPVSCTTNLPGSIAEAVDADLDDGKADTGTLRGFTQTAANTPDLDSTAAYTDDGSTQYTLCRQI